MLLAVHLMAVGWLTMRPRAVPWVAPTNLHPLATIRADLASGPHAALEGIGGGLALLAPLGVLLPLVLGRLNRPLLGTATRTVLIGVLASLGVALLQSGVPGHVVNVDSVLLNSAGVALAHLLVYLPLRARLRRNGAAADAATGGVADRDKGERGDRKEYTAYTRTTLREEGVQASTPRPPRVGMAP